jgi:hypothetical protein
MTSLTNSWSSAEYVKGKTSMKEERVSEAYRKVELEAPGNVHRPAIGGEAEKSQPAIGRSWKLNF